MARKVVTVDEGLHLPTAVQIQLKADLDAEFSDYVTDAQTAASSASLARDQAVEAASTATAIVTGDLDIANEVLITDEDSLTRKSIDRVNNQISRGLTVVVVGNSNCVVGLWPSLLATRFDWDVHNYAVPGTGFGYGDSSTSYNGQVNTAAADTSFENADVDIVFIADAGNDIRGGSTSIPTLSDTCLANARTQFPNARIIVIPSLWGHATANETVASLALLAKTTVDLQDNARKNRCEFIQYSHTWAWGYPELMLPGEVHFTSAGHEVIAQYVVNYLSGTSTDRHMPWTLITPGSGFTISSIIPDMRQLALRRQGDDIFINGGVASTGTIPAFSMLGQAAKGLRPARECFFTGYHVNGTTVTPVSIRMLLDGQFQIFNSVASAGTICFDCQIPAF